MIHFSQTVKYSGGAALSALLLFGFLLHSQGASAEEKAPKQDGPPACEADNGKIRVGLNLRHSSSLLRDVFKPSFEDANSLDLCLVPPPKRRLSWRAQFDGVLKVPTARQEDRFDIALVLPSQSGTAFRGAEILLGPTSVKNVSEATRGLSMLFSSTDSSTNKLHWNSIEHLYRFNSSDLLSQNHAEANNVEVDKDVKLLAIMSTAPKFLHTVRPINHLKALLSLRVIGRSSSYLAAFGRLGIKTDVIRSKQEQLSAFEFKQASAFFGNMSELNRSELADVTRDVLPISFYALPVALVMNKQSYDRLNSPQKAELVNASNWITVRWIRYYDERNYNRSGEKQIFKNFHERRNLREEILNYSVRQYGSGKEDSKTYLKNSELFESILDKIRDTESKF